MNYPKQIWDQLKNKTCDDLIRALKKDGWQHDTTIGAEQIYLSEDGKRVSIHYHPKKTYKNPGLLKKLLDDIGWSVEKMKKLKFVK